MELSAKKIILSNLTLKIVSLIIGYGFWFTFSQSHTIAINVDVPLCFHSTSKQYTVSAPEYITVNLAGRRSDLLNIDLENLALHVDAAELMVGEIH